MCIGASTPLFLVKPSLKSVNCPSPPFYAIPPCISVFRESHPYMPNFSVNAKNIKVFILNPILSFKSN